MNIYKIVRLVYLNITNGKMQTIEAGVFDDYITEKVIFWDQFIRKFHLHELPEIVRQFGLATLRGKLNFVTWMSGGEANVLLKNIFGISGQLVKQLIIEELIKGNYQKTIAFLFRYKNEHDFFPGSISNILSRAAIQSNNLQFLELNETKSLSKNYIANSYQLVCELGQYQLLDRYLKQDALTSRQIHSGCVAAVKNEHFITVAKILETGKINLNFKKGIVLRNAESAEMQNILLHYTGGERLTKALINDLLKTKYMFMLSYPGLTMEDIEEDDTIARSENFELLANNPTIVKTKLIDRVIRKNPVGIPIFTEILAYPWVTKQMVIDILLRTDANYYKDDIDSIKQHLTPNDLKMIFDSGTATNITNLLKLMQYIQVPTKTAFGVFSRLYVKYGNELLLHLHLSRQQARPWLQIAFVVSLSFQDLARSSFILERGIHGWVFPHDVELLRKREEFLVKVYRNTLKFEAPEDFLRKWRIVAEQHNL